jgi:Na+-driven multidrug efflux pump
MNAFYQATLTGVSQNYGARNEKRINKFIFIPLICGVITGLVLGGACVLFARPLLGIYITDSPEAIEIGVIRLWMTTAPYFLVAIMECLVGAIRGLGSSTIPAITSFIGTCGVRMMWVLFVLPHFREEWVLFIAWPISWVFVIVCHSITLAFVKPRAIKKMREQE